MAEEFQAARRGGPLADLKLCLAALTRLPVRLDEAAGARPLAEAAWAFPVVGLGVGLLGGIGFGLARQADLAPGLAAAVALAATVLATGALHEDGLADMADGCGGGRDAAAKLAIMRDSRIGTYGVIALVLAFALRLGALDTIAQAAPVAAALLAAGAMSRAGIVLVMRLGAPARSDGLAAAAGRADVVTLFVAAAIALAAGVVLIGFWPALLAAAAAMLAALGVLGLALRQIGGTTGDVLGAAQQAAEVAVLLVASALL
jgi:adenosylcobinamide-GDP ribazoletransferase